MRKKNVSSKNKEPEYVVPEAKHFRARVNQGSRLSMLNNIDDYVDASDWQKLLDSQLGGVVQLAHSVKFSSQMVHYALQRQLASDKEWETWYRIKGKLRRFSLKEFALVTGLRCSQPTASDMEDDEKAIKDFFGNEKMTVGDLETELKNSMLVVRSPQRRFKLVLLYIVEGVLLGEEQRKGLRSWIVRLVENVDRFLAFPWGRVIYAATHVSLNGAVKRREAEIKAEDRKKRNGYGLMGYPLSFQVTFSTTPMIIL